MQPREGSNDTEFDPRFGCLRTYLSTDPKRPTSHKRKGILTAALAALDSSKFKRTKNGGGEGTQPSLMPLLRFEIQGVALAA